MGKGPEKTVLQGRYTDGQQALETMLNITDYYIMQIKTTVRYHLTPVRMAIINKFTNNKCWRGVEKREPSYTVGGNGSWYNHCGEQYGGT